MPRAWHLKSRPETMAAHENFELKEFTQAPMGDGTIRVANKWLSVDPYMRGRMRDVKSYVPPFAIGEPMQGGAIGEVVESNADGFDVGDMVQHMAGWRDEAVVPAAEAQKLPDLGIPIQSFLGFLGMPGMTAYFGLLDVAAAKEGDIVFVSGAAGAVGSTVIQIAKAKGMTAIGSAGGQEKCDWVKSLGADAVIDYKADGELMPKLMEAAPNGIDVYFDNVGGEHLDAAFAVANPGARFAECGMISGYNSTDPMCFRYIMNIIGKGLRIRGFIVTEFMDRMGEFHADMGGMLQAGKLTGQETVHEGLNSQVDAFIGLFTGGNTGKMLVSL
ncbi:NADP-dependent oxidoreductase [Parasphingopyxis algicola]|uniref:NADP-dependent oxidoreductase n=1 Tax=Parasphingopyxis algicola TaxID=2026624 RepID=UPI0015A1E530|nr:NADP-dependent oxidoreductase [Parasphingopyxis algicola]QLC25860.1 NADP-dependent oxidoreductase [Parasphingopyxis algicola]